MDLCAACGFSATEWTRFGVFRQERSDGKVAEHPYQRKLVRECRLVRSYTAYGAQR